MPIGKNAIKRVTNNGYSNVETSAPDMENSVVTEEKKETPKKVTQKKKDPVTEAKTQKKQEVKKEAPAPKKSMETEPDLAPVNTLNKVLEDDKREGEGYVNLGGNLPVHLL